MNFLSPLMLSIFVHFGLIFSLTNSFKIDFDVFNIEAKKPIQAYVIIEKEKENQKKIFIPKGKNKQINKNNESVSKKIEISDINFEIEQISKLEIKDEVKNNDNNIVSQTDLEIFSSMIKSQVMENWKRPTNLSSNLKTEIQITLVPTGEILSSKIINSSGNRAFDDSALTAISKLKSFDGLNMQMNLFDQHFRKFILIFSPE
ncbi:MAG: TonB family protein [SAR86 cluster bacterium]|jgi:colicin import membrane protein|nr:TonB family protein [SAR86 cluster bacterium]|tara:strand:+ start:3946 stop:4554 length:609 start_codon:yes stop_codon:yes gene_type:complete